MKFEKKFAILLFIDAYDALVVDNGYRRYLIMKLCNTIIRTTYFIFAKGTNPRILLVFILFEKPLTGLQFTLLFIFLL